MFATDKLFELADGKYAEFQAKLAPTVNRETFIGVRLPVLRKFASQYAKDPEAGDFLKSLPHRYYDENILHSILITKIKDFNSCIEAVESFLPYVDNWAVCDTLSPAALGKNREELFKRILIWVNSGKTYTIRFGVDMLMKFFLDEEFREEYLEIPALDSDEYYVNMMCAWFYATALAKQWDSTVKYLEEKRLTKFIHNKTIQKAIESYRITDSQKAYLKTLRV